MNSFWRWSIRAICIIAYCSSVAAPASAQSQLQTRELYSAALANTKVGTNPTRSILVYLPDGYESGNHRYPVIYYLPNATANYRADFDARDARGVLDRAIASGTIGKFILVVPDLTTPLGCSWYVNSSITGRWEDFIVQDMVRFVDSNFRTLPARNSRGMSGDRLGGYGAIRLGMLHPETFGSVYALHPVGTGSGLLIMQGRPNWELLAHARSLDELAHDPMTQLFVTIYQANLPNPDNAPLYFDPPAHRERGSLVIDIDTTERLRNNFLLETMIPRYAQNLKTLRGFKFDWGRSDPNQDHVYSNQAFTHKLDEYGIAHEAEEYRGGWEDGRWSDEGRVRTDVLPFFGRYLQAATPL